MKKILTRVTFFLIISLLLIVGSIWAIADKYEDDLKSFVIKNSEGDDFTLTHKQIKLLKLFIEKKDQVISRQEILEKVWGYDVYPSSRTIDNFVLLFRKVFEKNLPSSTYFKSVRGVGYKFTP